MDSSHNQSNRYLQKEESKNYKFYSYEFYKNNSNNYTQNEKKWNEEGVIPLVSCQPC